MNIIKALTFIGVVVITIGTVECQPPASSPMDSFINDLTDKQEAISFNLTNPDQPFDPTDLNQPTLREVFTQWETNSLTAHNYYRNRHGSPPLRLNRAVMSTYFTKNNSMKMSKQTVQT